MDDCGRARISGRICSMVWRRPACEAFKQGRWLRWGPGQTAGTAPYLMRPPYPTSAAEALDRGHKRDNENSTGP